MSRTRPHQQKPMSTSLASPQRVRRRPLTPPLETPEETLMTELSEPSQPSSTPDPTETLPTPAELTVPEVLLPVPAAVEISYETESSSNSPPTAKEREDKYRELLAICLSSDPDCAVVEEPNMQKEESSQRKRQASIPNYSVLRKPSPPKSLKSPKSSKKKKMSASIESDPNQPKIPSATTPVKSLKSDSNIPQKSMPFADSNPTKTVTKDAESKETERQGNVCQPPERPSVAAVTERACIEYSPSKITIVKIKKTNTVTESSAVRVRKPQTISRRQYSPISTNFAAKINRQPLFLPQSLMSCLLQSAAVQTANNWYHIIPVHREAAACSLRELVSVAIQYERQVLRRIATRNIHISELQTLHLNTVRPEMSTATASRSAETDIRWYELVELLESPGQRFYCRILFPRINASSVQTAERTAANSQTIGGSITFGQTTVTSLQAQHTAPIRVEQVTTATQYDLKTTTISKAVGTQNQEIRPRTNVAVGTDDSVNQIPKLSTHTVATQTQPISTKMESTACSMPKQVNAATQCDLSQFGGEIIGHASIQTTGFEVRNLASLCRAALLKLGVQPRELDCHDIVDDNNLNQYLATIDISVSRIQDKPSPESNSRDTDEIIRQTIMVSDIVDISNTNRNSSGNELFSKNISDGVVKLFTDSSQGQCDLERPPEGISENMPVDNEYKITHMNVYSDADTNLDMRPSTSRSARQTRNELKGNYRRQFKPIISGRQHSGSLPPIIELAMWQEIEDLRKAVIDASDAQNIRISSAQQARPTDREPCHVSEGEEEMICNILDAQSQSLTLNEMETHGSLSHTSLSPALIPPIPSVSMDNLVSTDNRAADRQIERRHSDSECEINRSHVMAYDTVERQNSSVVSQPSTIGSSLPLPQILASTQSDEFSSAQEIRAQRQSINNWYTELDSLNPDIIWSGRFLREPVDIMITMRHISGLTPRIAQWMGGFINISNFSALQILQNSIANLAGDDSRVLSLGYFLPLNITSTESYEMAFNMLNAALNESEVTRLQNNDIDLYVYPLAAGASVDFGTQSVDWIEFLDNEHRPNLLLAVIIHSKHLVISPFKHLFTTTAKRAKKSLANVTGRSMSIYCKDSEL